MMEFEKQTEIMDMKEEMMNDAIDDAMGDEDDEEESDAIVSQVLDELGLQMTDQLSGTEFKSMFSGHEFHETCRSVTFYFIKKDSKRCCHTRTPESIHTKDESKRGSAFAFIFGVN